MENLLFCSNPELIPNGTTFEHCVGDLCSDVTPFNNCSLSLSDYGCSGSTLKIFSPENKLLEYLDTSQGSFENIYFDRHKTVCPGDTVQESFELLVEPLYRAQNLVEVCSFNSSDNSTVACTSDFELFPGRVFFDLPVVLDENREFSLSFSLSSDSKTLCNGTEVLFFTEGYRMDSYIGFYLDYDKERTICESGEFEEQFTLDTFRTSAKLHEVCSPGVSESNHCTSDFTYTSSGLIMFNLTVFVPHPLNELRLDFRFIHDIPGKCVMTETESYFDWYHSNPEESVEFITLFTIGDTTYDLLLAQRTETYNQEFQLVSEGTGLEVVSRSVGDPVLITDLYSICGWAQTIYHFFKSDQGLIYPAVHQDSFGLAVRKTWPSRIYLYFDPQPNYEGYHHVFLLSNQTYSVHVESDEGHQTEFSLKVPNLQPNRPQAFSEPQPAFHLSYFDICFAGFNLDNMTRDTSSLPIDDTQGGDYTVFQQCGSQIFEFGFSLPPAPQRILNASSFDIQHSLDSESCMLDLRLESDDGEQLSPWERLYLETDGGYSEIFSYDKNSTFMQVPVGGDFNSSMRLIDENRFKKEFDFSLKPFFNASIPLTMFTSKSQNNDSYSITIEWDVDLFDRDPMFVSIDMFTFLESGDYISAQNIKEPFESEKVTRNFEINAGEQIKESHSSIEIIGCGPRKKFLLFDDKNSDSSNSNSDAEEGESGSNSGSSSASNDNKSESSSHSSSGDDDSKTNSENASDQTSTSSHSETSRSSSQSSSGSDNSKSNSDDASDQTSTSSDMPDDPPPPPPEPLPRPSAPAIRNGWGDPHLQTVDGVSFSYNGIGDYLLIRSLNNRTSPFQIQAFFDKVNRGSFVGSVIKSVAFEMDGEVIEYDHKEGMFRNKNSISMTDSRGTNLTPDSDIQVKWYKKDGNTIVTISNPEASNEKLFTLRFIRRRQELNFVYSFPEFLFHNSEGLLGYWDENVSNDFKTSNGTTIRKSEASESEIYAFGQTWNLNNIQDPPRSLFHREHVLSEDANSFKPTFTEDIDIETVDHEIKDACSSAEGEEEIRQCILDVGATNDPEIAQFRQVVKQVEEEVKNEVIRIPSAIEGIWASEITTSSAFISWNNLRTHFSGSPWYISKIRLSLVPILPSTNTTSKAKPLEIETAFNQDGVQVDLMPGTEYRLYAVLINQEKQSSPQSSVRRFSTKTLPLESSEDGSSDPDAPIHSDSSSDAENDSGNETGSDASKISFAVRNQKISSAIVLVTLIVSMAIGFFY
eukprot:gb/GECH01009649.1/.p1 GENE.gb/GECH01009649.1/~~gb/GECH01009649.1/.p1  ORF type:complete len:1260 (+),score=161.94 gb/GECH01009649.1/:1-3780(+)